MSDIALALAEAKIEHVGKEYRLTPPDYNTHRDYVKYLEGEAIRAVVRNRDAYGKEFDGQMLRMGRDVGMGTYQLGGAAWKQSLDDPVNSQQLCFMVFKQDNPLSFQEFRVIWNADAKFVNREGKDIEGCKGDEIADKVGGFLERPNALRPDLAMGPVAS